MSHSSSAVKQECVVVVAYVQSILSCCLTHPRFIPSHTCQQNATQWRPLFLSVFNFFPLQKLYANVDSDKNIKMKTRYLLQHRMHVCKDYIMMTYMAHKCMHAYSNRSRSSLISEDFFNTKIITMAQTERGTVTTFTGGTLVCVMQSHIFFCSICTNKLWPLDNIP